jgi:hypothetical protein
MYRRGMDFDTDADVDTDRCFLLQRILLTESVKISRI